METASAGIRRDSDERLDAALVNWADAIFVMDKKQQAHVRSNYSAELDGKLVVALGIPDRFEFMDDQLFEVLRRKMQRYLP